MAFIRLSAPDDSQWLPTDVVVERLRREFGVVNPDHAAGRDYVGRMIAATEKFSDRIPGKQERLAELRRVHDAAVRVAFGDSGDNLAQVCLLPDTPLFFGTVEEVDGPARPLVDRCARVLGYELHEG